MRKMASVVTIRDIVPVPDTDNLIIITMVENLFKVLGNKQQGLNINDKVVYFETDAILPVEPQYEFLRSKCYNDRLKGYRIKAMKMRGVISQGLIFKGSDLGLNLACYDSGYDLTERLHVRKFEPVDDASPRCEKKTWKTHFMRFAWFRKLNAFITHETELEDFPVHLISKSDEDNLWNNPQFFTRYHDLKSYITVKMEGKSVTCYKEPRKFSRHAKFKVFGRNKSLYEPAELKWFDEHIKDKVENNIILQGEFCAPKVMKGIYHNGTHYYIYKIRSIHEDMLGSIVAHDFTLTEMIEYCDKHGLETVPILDKTLKDFDSIAALYEYTEQQGFIPADDVNVIYDPKVEKCAKHHEGIVVASFDRNGMTTQGPADWSFKVKSQEYMLEKK